MVYKTCISLIVYIIELKVQGGHLCKFEHVAIASHVPYYTVCLTNVCLTNVCDYYYTVRTLPAPGCYAKEISMLENDCLPMKVWVYSKSTKSYIIQVPLLTLASSIIIIINLLYVAHFTIIIVSHNTL